MVVRKSKKEEAERRRREQQRIFVEGLQPDIKAKESRF